MGWGRERERWETTHSKGPGPDLNGVRCSKYSAQAYGSCVSPGGTLGHQSEMSLTCKSAFLIKMSTLVGKKKLCHHWHNEYCDHKNVTH